MDCRHGLILSLHIFWGGGDIHARDKWFESRSNTLKMPGVIGAVTKRAVYLRLTLLYLQQNASRRLICNTPPTSWIWADVGPKPVLLPLGRSTVSTFNPWYFYIQCVPHHQEPYAGAFIINIVTWHWPIDPINWAVNKSKHWPRQEILTLALHCCAIMKVA